MLHGGKERSARRRGRPQPVLAPVGLDAARDRPAAPRRRASAPGCCASPAAAGTAAPTASPTPAGRSTRSAASSATSRSCSSATRWAAAPPCTSPTTRTCAAWSRSRPGCPPGETVAGPARQALTPPTAAATASPSPAATAAYVDAARPRSPTSPSSRDMGPLGHYLLPAVGPGTRSRLGAVAPAARWLQTALKKSSDETELFHRVGRVVRSDETKPFRFIRVNRSHRDPALPHRPDGRPRRGHPSARRGRPRAGDLRRHPPGARGGRLRPPHHGRRGQRGPGLEGDALPPLERQGGARHRRPDLPEGPARGPGHRHACAATCSRPSAASAASPTTARSPPSPACSPRSAATPSSPRLPRARRRPQGGRRPAGLRAGPGPRRAPRGRRPRPARAGARRHLSAPPLPDGPAARPGHDPPGGRPDHPARRAGTPRGVTRPCKRTRKPTCPTNSRSTTARPATTSPPSRRATRGWAWPSCSSRSRS